MQSFFIFHLFTQYWFHCVSLMFFSTLFLFITNSEFCFSVLCPTFDVVAIYASYGIFAFFIHSEEKKKLCKKSSQQKELHLCVFSVTNILFLQKGSIYIYQLTFWICVRSAQCTVYILQFTFGDLAFFLRFIYKQNKKKSILLQSTLRSIHFRWIPVCRCWSKFQSFFLSITLLFKRWANPNKKSQTKATDMVQLMIL